MDPRAACANVDPLCSKGMICRDDWHADLRSTRSKLAQAEQLARAKESEVEDLRKAYEVLLDHHHQTCFM